MNIQCGKYVYFECGDEIMQGGSFYLTDDAKEIIYRQKGIICSYSGANEWCNHMFCQFIDLFSGASVYNYALGAVDHEKEIPEIWKENKQSIIDWLQKSNDKDWFVRCCDAFDYMFERLPVCD